MSNSEYIIKFLHRSRITSASFNLPRVWGFFQFKILIFYLLLSSHTVHLLTAVLFKIFPTKPIVSCVSPPWVLWWEWSCSCCLEPFDLPESCFCHKNGIFCSDTFMQTDHPVFELNSIPSFFWKTKARDTFILEPNLSFIPSYPFFQCLCFFYDHLLIRFKKKVRICYFYIFLMLEKKN